MLNFKTTVLVIYTLKSTQLVTKTVLLDCVALDGVALDAAFKLALKGLIRLCRKLLLFKAMGFQQSAGTFRPRNCPDINDPVFSCKRR